MAADRRNRLQTLLTHDRRIVLLEILFFLALILLGIPPSTTIYLLLLGWLSLRLRDASWRDLGLRRPERWGKTLLLGVGGGLLYFALSTWGIEPLIQKIFDKQSDLSLFDSMVGNLAMLLVWLVAAWTLAAFGEEMLYRGYIQNRVEGLFGNASFKFFAGALTNALLFGLAHAYQGWTGAATSVVFGFVLSTIYHLNGRNLWACILFHGIFDTPGLIFIYLGLHL
ncbi:MAG: hypothetical protein DCC56_09225 [Anaerolineae bacterium]|nr:MAG: hypothetical protein DCC56_09225 [Anaerolineae bacterium]WKZ45227.1 MAG: CPBP family intramembrane metalloprotease [Anaerolineales bacterium]